MALFSIYFSIYLIILAIAGGLISIIVGLMMLKSSKDKATKTSIILLVPTEVFIIYSITAIAKWFNSTFSVPLNYKGLLIFTGGCIFYIVSSSRKSKLLDKYDKESDFEMSNFVSIWSGITTILYAICFFIFIFYRIQIVDNNILILTRYIDNIIQWILSIKSLNFILVAFSWFLCVGIVLSASWKILLQLIFLSKALQNRNT